VLSDRVAAPLPQPVIFLEPVAERYDEDRDELLVELHGQWIPAATHPDGPPRTKKFDIERGEDMKGW